MNSKVQFARLIVVITRLLRTCRATTGQGGQFVDGQLLDIGNVHYDIVVALKDLFDLYAHQGVQPHVGEARIGVQCADVIHS